MFSNVSEAVKINGYEGYVMKKDGGPDRIFAAICVDVNGNPCDFERCAHYQQILNDVSDIPGNRVTLLGFIGGYLTLWSKVATLPLDKRLIPANQVTCD